LVVKSDSYPFNILLEYSKTVDESTDVVEELEYVLAQLTEEDREALVKAIEELIVASANPSDQPSTPTTGLEGT
jgi:hypothetical protein